MPNKNILVVGAPQVGKKAFIHFAFEGKFIEDYTPCTKIRGDSRIVDETQFNFTVIPGSMQLRGANSLPNSIIHAVIFCVDPTNRKSLDYTCEQNFALRTRLGTAFYSQVKKFIVRTKSDLTEGIQVSPEELGRLCNDIDASGVYGCSALHGTFADLSQPSSEVSIEDVYFDRLLSAMNARIPSPAEPPVEHAEEGDEQRNTKGWESYRALISKLGPDATPTDKVIALLKDYVNPQKFSFLGDAFLARACTFHWNRNHTKHARGLANYLRTGEGKPTTTAELKDCLERSKPEKHKADGSFIRRLGFLQNELQKEIDAPSGADESMEATP